MGSVLLLLPLFGGQTGVSIDAGMLQREVGQHKRIGIIGTQGATTDFGEISLMLLLINDEEELLFDPKHHGLLHVRVHLGLELIQSLVGVGVLHRPEQLLVVGLTQFDLQEFAQRFKIVVGTLVCFFEGCPSIGHQTVTQLQLHVHQPFDGRLEAGERLLALDRCRPGNDERSAGFVHEDGVDLIHDTEPVIALDLIFLAGRHTVITQIIETELGGGAVSDVAAIHLTTHIGSHLLLNTTNRETQIPVKVAHPLGVTSGEVIIDRDQLRIAGSQRIEVKRQGGHEGLALTGRHFRDLALMQREATDELHIEVDHVPSLFVLVDDRSRSDQPPGGIFNRGEGFGQ